MKNKEIIVIILFIAFSTLLIFVVETLLYFNEIKTLNKQAFLNKLFWSFVKAFIIDLGLVVIYFINKNRINKGKSLL